MVSVASTRDRAPPRISRAAAGCAMMAARMSATARHRYIGAPPECLAPTILHRAEESSGRSRSLAQQERIAMPPRRAPGAPLDCEIRPEIVDIWGELALYHARLDRAFAPSRRWREEYRQFINGLVGRDDALAVVAT